MLSSSDKRTLWAAADKLRTNMDAAEYKHIVLGLIFLKYVSDAFTGHRATLKKRFADPDDEFFLDNRSLVESELEERDYYTAENVFWVPEAARWEHLQANARQPNIGVLVDKALEAIENDNPRLKNLLDKRFARTQLPTEKLGELIDLVSTIGFGAGEKARDVLGQVYEYFLGQFASAEGKKGGQFYTPESVVRVLVEILAPHQGRVYDPCCGSGGMFVQSEKFVESHQTKHHLPHKQDISIYGQESSYTTWRLAAMNLVIRGMDFNLGREAADTFLNDQHPDLKADYVLANPPFNVSDWWHPKLEGDVRWVYGTPPQGNANFGWLQHILHHLSPTGRAGVVLANGSMSSNSGGEGEIRRRMIEGDVVECMVALPPQLFFNTQIPACLWFLSRDKSGAGGKTDRRGQTLFIDARNLGRLETRVFRVLDEADLRKIADTYHAWRGDGDTDAAYEDVPGFCKSAELKEIEEHGFILTPGRYVGAQAIEEDAEAFAEKMSTLTVQLSEQFAQSDALEAEIKKNLAGLGYAI
jgi:type I restriction enzyme M protein